MRIYLTGFMAAGKTKVGRRLARLLESPFLDLDREVERSAGRSVAEIFAQLGEERFRELEHRCLRDTERLESVVVGTGGGTITFERNLELMRRLGVTVWLKPRFDALIERLERAEPGRRPLYRGRRQARELYLRRRADYARADLTVELSGDEKVSEVADKITALLRERQCGI